MNPLSIVSASILALVVLGGLSPTALRGAEGDATAPAAVDETQQAVPATGDQHESSPPAGGEKESAAPAKEQGTPPAGATKGQAPPANPFGEGPAGRRPDAVPGVIELSDGSKLPGDLFTTRGQDLKLFDAMTDEYRPVPLGSLTAIETVVVWERMDQQWRFKTPGDREKVYTGKTYPNRMFSYVLKVRDGKPIEGKLKGVPLYVQVAGEEPRLFVLHERQKGPVGSDLKALVYVKAVRFGIEARRAAEEELRKKAEEAKKAEAEKKAAAQKKDGGAGGSHDEAARQSEPSPSGGGGAPAPNEPAGSAAKGDE